MISNIESNVEQPKRRLRESRYDFVKIMKAGDSFTCTYTEAIACMLRARKLGLKLTGMCVEGKANENHSIYRLWLVAKRGTKNANVTTTN